MQHSLWRDCTTCAPRVRYKRYAYTIMCTVCHVYTYKQYMYHALHTHTTYESHVYIIFKIIYGTLIYTCMYIYIYICMMYVHVLYSCTGMYVYIYIHVCIKVSTRNLYFYEFVPTCPPVSSLLALSVLFALRAAFLSLE